MGGVMSMLSAQCDRLRAIADDLSGMDYDSYASDVRDAADTLWRLREDYVILRDEYMNLRCDNENLRELAHDMWRLLLATGNDDLVLSLEVNGLVKEVIDAEELAKTMRELGIEVD